MKLELSLPERPGLLHAMPVFDLFMLLWIVFVLGSALSSQTGVAVEMARSQFELERHTRSLVVTIAPGETEPQLYLGRDAMRFEELEGALRELQTEGEAANSRVLLRSDQSVPVGAQRRVEEMALALGFMVAVLGGEQAEEPALEDAPAPLPAPEEPSELSPPAPGSERETQAE